MRKTARFFSSSNSGRVYLCVCWCIGLSASLFIVSIAVFIYLHMLLLLFWFYSFIFSAKNKYPKHSNGNNERRQNVINEYFIGEHFAYCVRKCVPVLETANMKNIALECVCVCHMCFGAVVLVLFHHLSGIR